MKDLAGLRTEKRPRRERRQNLPRWSEVVDLRLVGAFLSGLLLVAVMAWLLDWLRDPQTLTIEVVEMEGEFREVRGRDIRRVMVQRGPMGFFSVDMAGMQRAVEGLPWVASASVRRIWPDRLGVSVEEHEPLARWGEDGVVSTEGVLFRPDEATLPEGGPHFHGPDELAAELVERYGTMSRIVAALDRDIATIRVDERRSWQLTLDNGIEVVLGRDRGRARLERLVANWNRRLAPHEEAIRRIDLRYTNGFAVRWREDERPEQLGVG